MPETPPHRPSGSRGGRVAFYQGCRYLYSTWKPARPRGCHYFGFESRGWPSEAVLTSSGKPCEAREELQGKGVQKENEGPTGDGPPTGSGKIYG